MELGLETTKWYKLTEAAEARCSRAAAARDARGSGEVWLGKLWAHEWWSSMCGSEMVPDEKKMR